jgi:hypothetical protein
MSVMVLTDWLGDGGKPVAPELAEQRASICVHCPENRSPNWWEKYTNAIALWIRRALMVKNNLGYKVPQEDDLFMCRKCGCCLRLKVHVPIAHIRAHTSDLKLGLYPAYCWQRIESNL